MNRPRRQRSDGLLEALPLLSLGRRQFVVGTASAAMLSACGGGGNSIAAADAGFDGAVYSATNRPEGNTVAAFGRRENGMLEAIAEYSTGGSGGVLGGNNDGLDPLIAEDAIVAIDDRFLLVVNAGSDSIASMRINADFSLSLIGTVSTGGVGPNSIAYSNGLVYVADADSDGVFTGAADQSGNVTGFRFDTTSGALTPIAASTRQLGNRPSDLAFSPDGRFLIVSSWNSGSTRLPGGSDAELQVYGVQADGSLTASAVSAVTSTPRGNAAGRNLPASIGFAAVAIGARTFVIASEAREFLSSGDPTMLPQFQTASVSTWELNADGSMTPRSQDVLTGAALSVGPASPTSACWIVVAPDRSVFWVAHASGGVIASFRLAADGSASLIDSRAFAGNPAVVGAANPLATADGLVDMAVSSDGRHVYQLLDLKGSIVVFDSDGTGALAMLQQTQGLLPVGNSVGLVSVDRRSA